MRGKLFTTALAAVCVVLLAGPALAADEMTAGGFLLSIAGLKGLPAADAPTAAGALRASGYAIPEIEPNTPLTERIVVDIAAALGLQVTTTRPDAPFTSEQADAFLAAFAAEIAGGSRSGEQTATDDEEEMQKSQARRRGRTRSRSEPI